MLSFKAYLTEIFQQHYPYEHSHHGDSSAHGYDFKTDKGNHYSVAINHRGDPKHADIHFVPIRPGSMFFGSMRKTGDEGQSSAKVFGTVHHIIKHHVEQHGITHLHFTGSNKEPGRVRLYHHMVTRLGHEFKEKAYKKKTHFTIHIK